MNVAFRKLQEGRGNLGLLATSHGMNHVYQLLAPLIIPKITLDYGLSNTTAGLLLLCYVLPYAFLQVASGILSRRFGRKNLLVSGFILSALSFLAIGLTSNIVIAGLFLFLAGAGGSTYHPNGVPYLAEANPDRRGRTLGLHQTGGALGSVLGLFVASIIVQSLTWRPSLMILALPGLLLASVLWFSIESHPKSKTEKSEKKLQLRRIGVYGPALIYIVAAFIFVLGQRGTDLFGNDYFVIGRGIGFVEASTFFVLLKVAGLFSAPLCGALSDKLNRKSVLIFLVIVESLSLYAITITPVTLLVIPCLVFGFAAFGLLGVGEALLADLTDEKNRNTVFGLNYTASFSASVLLAPTLGFVADRYSFATGFVALSAIMPLSIILLILLKEKSSQRKTCATPIQN